MDDDVDTEGAIDVDDDAEDDVDDDVGRKRWKKRRVLLQEPDFETPLFLEILPIF